MVRIAMMIGKSLCQKEGCQPLWAVSLLAQWPVKQLKITTL